MDDHRLNAAISRVFKADKGLEVRLRVVDVFVGGEGGMGVNQPLHGRLDQSSCEHPVLTTFSRIKFIPNS